MSGYFDPTYFDAAYFDAEAGLQPEAPAASGSGGFKVRRRLRQQQQSMSTLDPAVMAEDDYLMAEVI